MPEEPDTMEPNAAIKQLHDLASIDTPSTRHMALEERASGIMVMLDDLSKLARNDGCVAAAWAMEMIEVLQAENQSLRSHIVEWKPGGFNGTELPEDLASGTPILAHAYLDEHFVAVKFGRDDTGYWFTPLPGVHCDIEWEDIDYWIPLSSIPLPQPPVTER